MAEDTPITQRGPGVIAPPPLLFLAPLLGGFLLDRLLPLPPLPRALRGAGPPLVAAGIGLCGWFVATMQRAGTPVDVTKPPTALVQDGPFRRTRNPGYVGLALGYSGLVLAAGGRWPLILLPGALTVVDRGVIQREESYLEQRFGADYRDYRQRVRRWL
ncbi:MAG: isoprenylcysteine carboxylmethyltransferase family protein [Candidatus Dormibacteraeota bacterium]|nr:isoprenylcysteine carboxylmethyltransferase family protein [Candidatus Dormibacteraeota bacterium]